MNLGKYVAFGRDTSPRPSRENWPLTIKFDLSAGKHEGARDPGVDESLPSPCREEACQGLAANRVIISTYHDFVGHQQAPRIRVRCTLSRTGDIVSTGGNAYRSTFGHWWASALSVLGCILFAYEEEQGAVCSPWRQKDLLACHRIDSMSLVRL